MGNPNDLEASAGGGAAGDVDGPEVTSAAKTGKRPCRMISAVASAREWAEFARSWGRGGVLEVLMWFGPWKRAPGALTYLLRASMRL